MLSWGWDVTTTKSTLQCWSSPPVFPSARPGGSPLLLPLKTPLSHLPPTPTSPTELGLPPTPPTSSPSSSPPTDVSTPAGMHLLSGHPGDWTPWGSSEVTGVGRAPPSAVFPGLGSPSPPSCPGLNHRGEHGTEVDDVYRYKEQLRTEQLVQAYMDAFRQSLEQECSPNSSRHNNSPSNNNNSNTHSNDNNHMPGPCDVTPLAVTSDTPAIHYLQQLLPFAYTPSLLPETGEDDGKPLDLSATSQTNKANGDDRDSMSPLSGKPSVELKVPQIMKSGKKKDLNGKKAYTEEELAAAVNDIRSGKLGTRRAAVLYGIPRSTLRNKIFKLESEQNAENGIAAHDSKLSMVDLLQGMPNGGAEYPTSAGFNFSSDNGMLSSKLLFPGEEIWEQKIEQIRRKHNLLEPDRKFGMPLMHFPSGHHLSDFEKSYFGSPFGSDLKLAFLPELVRRMAEERMEMERQQSLQALQLDLRVPRSLEGMAGLALNGTTGPHSNTNNHNNNNAGVELKVPSYKPMRTTAFRTNGFMGGHHHTNGEEDGEHTSMPSSRNNNTLADSCSTSSNNNSHMPKIGDTLKDIIAKTIAEKMRCKAMMSNSMHQLNINSNLLGGHSNPGPLSSDSSSISSNDMGPVEKKPRLGGVKDHHHDHLGKSSLDDKNKMNSSSDGNNSSSENKSGRKTRPKRGQYRKYNSQLLLEAVRAVQRGEMSVHRAGSYFGVPHSTLEYKVKERHLLRHKKLREAGGRTPKKEGGAEAVSNNTGSCSTATSTTTTTPNSQSSSRSVTPVSMSPPLPTNSAMSVISSLAHQASSPGALRLGSSLTGSLGLGGLAGWSSPPNGGSSLPLLPADPSMGAYPAGFALNTSASELLKKLQRKVQAKASMTESQSTGEMAAALRAAAAAAAAAATSNTTQGSSTETAPPVVAQ